MKTYRTSNVLRNIGLPLAATGMILFASPTLSEASELTNEILHVGVEGEHVQSLQVLLSEKGLLENSQINDIYNASTSAAVTSFQEKHNLFVDGIAGPQTLGALAVLSQGDKGELVKELQAKLQSHGYYKAEKDGIFGPLTHKAVTSFQHSQDIVVDGLAGPETYASLYHYSATYTEPEKVEQEVTVETSKQPTNIVEGAQENNQTTFEMEATAYTAYCEGCSGVTATGIDLRNNPHKKVIAVDPSVIKLGTRVHVEGYGEAIAGDTGGVIQGNKVDLHFPTKAEANQFGRQTVTVTVIE